MKRLSRRFYWDSNRVVTEPPDLGINRQRHTRQPPTGAATTGLRQTKNGRKCESYRRLA